MTATATTPSLLDDLRERFGADSFQEQSTRDGQPTIWIASERLVEFLRHLQSGVRQPFEFLYDLFAIDERQRTQRPQQPSADFTLVYHLISLDRSAEVRLKVALRGETPEAPSILPLWPGAAWYERECYDMFGITFRGHPHLRRLLMPQSWQGHPLRKEHPARATEMGPFVLTPERQQREEHDLQFRPEDYGLTRAGEDTEFMFLNLGPHHPGTHGLLRIVLQLDGEEVVDAVPEIGFHHRGAEKMGERQSWHTFIPYTDRIDYLGGVLNNLPYVLSVEKLAGIEVPDRVKVIRVMMCEFFRVASHLVWYGTFAQDLGAMSPVFYMFNDRERLFDVVEAICGGRMHPSWFRIGGVAMDLPQGWERLVGEFLRYMPRRLAEYDRMVLKNKILRARTVGIGTYSRKEAMQWGLTGAGLRACGVEWDWRKQRPYSGYENFEFEVPTAERGDCYARAQVRVEEMRQSLRIIQQCLDHMPAGSYKADHPLTCPPRKERTMHDIETLIHHFLSVSWGPVIPAGEACVPTEASKGMNSYYLVSDGGTMAYRTRIRTPSFPHLQMLPAISRGGTVSDLVAILGSLDFVLADVDR